MAKTKAAAPKAGGKGLMTLSEVGKRTKISMPTLQKYKKIYSDRIPSEGEGRKQRYPEESLKVFVQLREENLARRGRPSKKGKKPAARKPAARKTAAKKPAAKKPAAKKPAAKKPARTSRVKRVPSPSKKAAASPPESLLTLTAVSNKTGIAYATLQKYVKQHADEIPFVGEGRTRRYKDEAVAVFRRIRKAARVGRPAKKAAPKSAAKPAVAKKRAPRAAASGDLRAVTAALAKLEKRIARMEAQLSKPVRIEIKR